MDATVFWVVAPVFLGCAVESPPPRAASSTLSSPSCVTRVAGEGAALGLEVGDRVCAWAEGEDLATVVWHDLASVFDWHWLVRERSWNEPTHLRIERAGHDVEVTIEPGSKDDDWLAAHVSPDGIDPEQVCWTLYREAQDETAAQSDPGTEPPPSVTPCHGRVRVLVDEQRAKQAQAAGRRTEAVEILEALVAVDPGLVRTSLVGADVARRLGRLLLRGSAEDQAEGVGWLQQAAETYQSRRGRSSRGWILATGYLGRYERDRGAFEDAQQRFGAAAAAAEGHLPDLASWSLNEAGNVARWRGAYGDAADYYRQALAIVERDHPQGNNRLAVRTNLANLDLARGHPARAAMRYEEVLSILATREGYAEWLATAYDNLGVARLVQLIRRQQRAPERPLTLSAVQETRNAFERAATYLEATESTTDVRRRRARNLENRGDLASLVGDLETAGVLHGQALRLRRHAAPGTTEVAHSLLAVARLDRKAGRFETARDRAGEAFEIIRVQAPGTDLAARACFTRARIEEAMGQLDAAERSYRQAIEHLDAQVVTLGGLTRSEATFRVGFEDDLHAFLQLLVHRGRFGEALEVMAGTRARVLARMLATRDLRPRGAPEHLLRSRETLNLRYERLQRQRGEGAKEPQVIAQHEAEAARLRAERDALDEQIEEAVPALARRAPVGSSDADRLRATLAPGTLMLAYEVGAQGSLLLATSQRLPPQGVVLPVDGPALRAALDALRDLGSIRQRSFRAWRSHTETLAWLCGQLLEPARAWIDDHERLLIVPHGPLQLLPWNALLCGSVSTAETDRALRYLVEWKPLRLAPSIATLPRRLRRSADDPRPPVLAAFGDPRYEHGGEPAARGGWPTAPLPGTRREIEAIGRRFQGRAELFLGRRATERAVRALDRSVTHVHFAAHGWLDSSWPLDAGILLSTESATKMASDDGLLQAWEVIEELELDADVVVLSGCDTGQGDILGSEGLLGLTRAFQIAGAGAVLATLWPIVDHDEYGLVSRFYEAMGHGLPIDDALRTAQLAVLRALDRADAGTRSTLPAPPALWAGFQLYDARRKKDGRFSGGFARSDSWEQRQVLAEGQFDGM